MSCIVKSWAAFSLSILSSIIDDKSESMELKKKLLECNGRLCLHQSKIRFGHSFHHIFLFHPYLIPTKLKKKKKKNNTLTFARLTKKNHYCQSDPRFWFKV